MIIREHLITHRGRSNVSADTWAALKEAERLAGFRFVITQGGYNAGAVEASAGTHDGGGVVDIRARDLSPSRRAIAVRCLRKVGFAAWLRLVSQGFAVIHIHAVLKGDQDLSRSAAAQVRSFEQGRTGLKSNQRDTSTDPYRGVTWATYLASRPTPPKPLTPAKPSCSATPNEDDDMPLTKADADLIASRLLAHDASNGKSLNDLLVTTYNRAGVSNKQGTAIQAMIRAHDIDEDKLAAAIVAALPDGGVDQAAVEQAVRNVFGSLDEEVSA